MRTDLISNDRDKLEVGTWVIFWNNRKGDVFSGRIIKSPVGDGVFWRLRVLLQRDFSDGTRVSESCIAMAGSNRVNPDCQIMIVDETVATSKLAISLLLDVSPDELR